MWFDKAVVYQIYPIGLCGAPRINDDEEGHRILGLKEWTEHIKRLGADTVLLNPVCESDSHGYDTRNYFTVDNRLGTEEELAEVCRTFHENGLKVMFDGVFNHVGRGFFAFKDVQEKKWDSQYKDWFHINFDGNNDYNDGFWYEGWEGHYELVKLNLRNPAVVEHQFEAIRSWVSKYDIDGLRLDVAYCLPEDYLKKIRAFANEVKEDFVLLGETLHGDYNRWMGPELCHSVTNYECYKGLWSSFNSMNMFEICHSLARQFGPEQWTLYKGAHLLSFADNHDVNRIATMLSNKEHLPLVYAFIFGMPGVPSIYYGSEWGIEGDRNKGVYDYELRPEIETPQWNDLTDYIAKLAGAHKNSDALCYGSYRNVVLTNKQAVFERKTDTECVYVAVNADSETFYTRINEGYQEGEDLITGKLFNLGEEIELPPYCAYYIRVR